MAAKKQQLKTKRAGSKTSRERKNPKQQPGKALHTPEEQQKHRAADGEPKEIAALLSRKAMAGDLDSAKLLFTMADRTQPTKPAEPAKKIRPGMAYLQQLALDPPWQGEPYDGCDSPQDPPPNPQ